TEKTCDSAEAPVRGPVRDGDSLRLAAERFVELAREHICRATRSQQQAVEGEVPGALGEPPSLVQELFRLLDGDAEARAQVHDTNPRQEAEIRRLGRLGDTREELPYPAPVTCRLDRVSPARPFPCAPVPARRLEQVARALPVVGEERGALVELVAVPVLDRPRHH